jgi:2-methylfumaryl-CoA isomerase
VLWETYRTFTELAADPGLRANPLMSTVAQPGVGEYLAPGSPLSVDGVPGRARPAPRLGEHTAEVFGDGEGAW